MMNQIGAQTIMSLAIFTIGIHYSTNPWTLRSNAKNSQLIRGYPVDIHSKGHLTDEASSPMSRIFVDGMSLLPATLSQILRFRYVP